jgi:alkyl hydroperoxide reductase subunit AhpF
MTPQEIEAVSRWAAELRKPPRLALIPGEEGNRERFTEFAERMKALVPGLTVKKEDDAPFAGPAFLLGPHQNVAYRAIPEGLEMAPFLEALAGRDGAGELAPNVQTLLGKLDLPLPLTLYISPFCPNCPTAVRRLTRLAAASAQIRLTIVDAALFAEQAQADNIRAVPTVILDESFRWTGDVDLAELLEIAIGRDPAKLSAASLRQMLEAGDAPKAARMMADRRALFPALLDLLTHPRWSVRLGAMVTVEYLVESAPEVAAGAITPLWERFAGLDRQAQGDVVQVLGQLTARDCLQAIASGDFHAEVKEAAREELEED